MANSQGPQVAASKRHLGLDLLRVLALVLVLGRHMEPRPDRIPLAGFWDAWHANNGAGVDLFFVLSGFLVSGLLFSEYKKLGSLSISRFYVRRGWKIYPSFYVLLLFACLYQWLALGQPVRDRALFSELVFIQNYNAPFWNHTWTLAAEEHFYLLLPLVLSILIRKNRGAQNPFRAVPYLVLAVSISCLAIRIANYLLRSDYSFRTHVFPTHLRIDSLLFGVAISYAHHFHGPWLQRTFRPLRHVLIALGVAVLASAALLPSYRGFYVHTFGFTVHYLATGALMVGVMHSEVPSNRLTISIAKVATFSYSIFLWHMALMYWAMPHLRALSLSWELRTAIYMLGAMAIGTTMAHLLELPLLRYRDRKFPSRLRASRQTAALPSPTMAPSSTAGPSPVAAGQFIPGPRALTRASA